MRTMLIAVMTALALGSTPAAAKTTWSAAHRAQYRALKRQVRQEYRAMKRLGRRRPLSSAEKQRFTALREARGYFGEAAFRKTLGHGVTGLAAGMMAAELASLFRGNSGVGRLGLVSAGSLGLSMGPGYALYQESRRSRARGIVQARRAGVPVSGLLRTSARRTLLQEARAKRDLARVMSSPSLAGAASATRLAESLE